MKIGRLERCHRTWRHPFATCTFYIVIIKSHHRQTLPTQQVTRSPRGCYELLLWSSHTYYCWLAKYGSLPKERISIEHTCPSTQYITIVSLSKFRRQTQKESFHSHLLVFWGNLISYQVNKQHEDENLSFQHQQLSSLSLPFSLSLKFVFIFCLTIWPFQEENRLKDGFLSQFWPTLDSHITCMYLYI